MSSLNLCLSKMRVYIAFQLKHTPSGGGNQFLRALQKIFISNSAYTDEFQNAQVLLFNSHQYILETAILKQKYPDKIFIHRIDGPIRLYNVMSDKRDLLTNTANKILADATVFQSSWSKQQNYQLGLKPNNFETIIMNAPDPDIFNRQDKVPFATDRKVRLIATSWSSNWKKGFDVYKWIDENMDFTHYEMVFVGNSPVQFKNIKHIPPLTSPDLAQELKKSDIFITASRIECCSNSLIEALHCGLPVIAPNRSSYPEIIGKAGMLFERPEEIPAKLELIVENYEQYQKNINLPTIEEVGAMYYNFFESIYRKVKNGEYRPKKLKRLDFVKIQSTLFYWQLSNKFNSLKQKIFQ